MFERFWSEIIEQFIVEPSEPQDGVGRFDLLRMFVFSIRRVALAEPR